MRKEMIEVVFVLFLFSGLVSGIEVSLESPSDDYEKDLQAPTEEITFTCSAFDDKEVSNVSLYGDWHDDGWGVIRYDESVDNNSEVDFKDTLGFGKHVWNCKACDNESHCVFADDNYTLVLVSEEGEIFWKETIVVSNFDYGNGITKKFLSAYRYRIYLNETYYFIGASKVDDDYINLNVTGVGSQKMLPGETKYFDVTGDGIYEFSVHLEAIINRAAYLTLKEMEYNASMYENATGNFTENGSLQNANNDLENSETNLSSSGEINNSGDESEGLSSVYIWFMVGLGVVSIGAGLFFYFNLRLPSEKGKGINLNANQQKIKESVISNKKTGSESDDINKKLPDI